MSAGRVPVGGGGGRTGGISCGIPAGSTDGPFGGGGGGRNTGP